MKLPHPIPYQGSKRTIANQILRFFPKDLTRLVEPFAGSLAVTIASAYYFKASKFVVNDINKPLMDLWKKIIYSPKDIIRAYHDIWYAQIGDEENYYYGIRDKFNNTQEPEYLLFLLTKCVKASVRYNAKGEFNQSLDKRRLGRHPEMMTEDILRVSTLLKGRIKLYYTDYSKILEESTKEDLIYFDPPYQGTGINGGFNYISNIDLDDFFISLYKLNKKRIPFILSFDGRTGAKHHGEPLPEALKLLKVEINAGRSSQATLLNRNECTYESLYLSPALINLIDIERIMESLNTRQSDLFEYHVK